MLGVGLRSGCKLAIELLLDTVRMTTKVITKASNFNDTMTRYSQPLSKAREIACCNLKENYQRMRCGTFMTLRQRCVAREEQQRTAWQHMLVGPEQDSSLLYAEVRRRQKCGGKGTQRMWEGKNKPTYIRSRRESRKGRWKSGTSV